mgnify:CR=1 FL=1
MGRVASEVQTQLRAGFSFPNLAGQKEVLSRFLLLGMVALFCLNIYPCLLPRFDYPALEQRYKNWMAGLGNTEWFIGDNDLYAYAGWRYVKGASPDEINFEHPPLAKYLIGLSCLVFSNSNVISAVLGVCSLLILYELCKKLLGDSLFALVPVYMLSLDRLFVGFSSTSMLDIYLVFFLLLSVLLFGCVDSDVKMFGGAVALGLASACKLTAPFAIPSLMIPVIARRKKTAWKFLLQGLLVAAFVYCLSYAWFFMLGHGLSDFLKLQWEMFMYQYGRRYGALTPGLFLLTLLTGVAGPETRNIIYVDEISRTFTVVTKHGLAMVREFNILTWPLCFSAAILSFSQAVRTRNTGLFQSCVYFFSFLVPFIVAQSFVWYLLPALPIGLLLLTNTLKKIVEESNWKLSSLIFLIYLAALFLWSRLVNIPSFIEL